MSKWPTALVCSRLDSDEEGQGNWYVEAEDGLEGYGPTNKPSAGRIRRWMQANNPRRRFYVVRAPEEE